jgi:hypothetical protein
MACAGNASFEDYGGSFPLYQGGEFFKFFYDARDLLPKPVQVQTRKQFKLRFNVFRIEALIRCSDAVEVKLLAGGQRSDIVDTSWAVLAFYEGVAAVAADHDNADDGAATDDDDEGCYFGASAA